MHHPLVFHNDQLNQSIALCDAGTLRAARNAGDIASKMSERHARSLAGVCQELFSSPESE